jgi:hypothetical protein
MKTPRTTKIAKSKQANALTVLRGVLATGEISAEDLVGRLPRRVVLHHTWCACEDLRLMGLLQGQGQHPTMSKGVPATYTVTELGRAVAGWL